MNIYRILGDLCLISSTPIFTYKAITQGPTGISLTTQCLRLLMFSARYLDVLTVFISPYNILMKYFLVVSTLILVVILSWQKLTRPGKKDVVSAISSILVIVLNSFFASTWLNYRFTLMEILWSFSRIIEPFVEIPQLTEMYQMDKWDTWIVIYYSTICANVFFNVGNWTVKYLYAQFFDPITVFCALSEFLVIAGFFIARLVKTREEVPFVGHHFPNDRKDIYVVDDEKATIIVNEDIA